MPRTVEVTCGCGARFSYEHTTGRLRQKCDACLGQGWKTKRQRYDAGGPRPSSEEWASLPTDLGPEIRLAAAVAWRTPQASRRDLASVIARLNATVSRDGMRKGLCYAAGVALAMARRLRDED